MTYIRYFIISPRPIIYIFTETDLRLFCFAKDFNAKYGKYAASKLPMPKHYCLSFTDGLQRQIAKPTDNDEVVISGKALVQLMILHSMREGSGEFKIKKHLKYYFEGNALNSAGRYLEEVVSRLAGRSDKGGSTTTYSVATERALRPEFWEKAILPGAYSNATKPS